MRQIAGRPQLLRTAQSVLGRMSSDTAALWRGIFAQFKWHQQPTDATPQDAMNRIAQKCLYLPERHSFDPSNCSVRSESLSKGDLDQLRTFHCRAIGYPSADPVVVIEWHGHRVVIEGNTRVNRWRTEETRGPFPAIFVVPNAA